MHDPTLLGYCMDVYIPTRVGMKAASAAQLRCAAKLYNVRLSELCEVSLSRALANYCRTHAPSTANSKRRAILTLWDAAAFDDLCRPPNRKRVQRAREFRHVPLAWTTSEIDMLVATSLTVPGELGGVPKRLWWPSLILAVWNTGARIGSLMTTRTMDCNLAECYILVRAETDKTGSDRFYPLLDQTIASIASHYSRDRQLLWPWPWHRRRIWVHFRKIVIAAGLTPNASMGLFHKLRCSTLSYTAAGDTAAGGGLELARVQAGHASAQTTLQHYIDPRIARQRSAIDVLPRLNLPDEQGRLF